MDALYRLGRATAAEIMAEMAAAPGMTERLNAGRRRAREQGEKGGPP